MFIHYKRIVFHFHKKKTPNLLFEQPMLCHTEVCGHFSFLTFLPIPFLWLKRPISWNKVTKRRMGLMKWSKRTVPTGNSFNFFYHVSNKSLPEIVFVLRNWKAIPVHIIKFICTKCFNLTHISVFVGRSKHRKTILWLHIIFSLIFIGSIRVPLTEGQLFIKIHKNIRFKYLPVKICFYLK